MYIKIEPKKYTNFDEFKIAIDKLDTWCDSYYDDDTQVYLSFTKPTEVIGKFYTVDDYGYIYFDLV